jgi:hypothetical protein
MIDCIGEASPHLPIPVWMIHLDYATLTIQPMGISFKRLKVRNLKQMHGPFYHGRYWEYTKEKRRSQSDNDR